MRGQVYDTGLSTPGGSAYAAYWHPELFKDGGRTMVFSVCMSNAGDSKPYLGQVTLASA